MNKRLPEFGWVPDICAPFQKNNLRRSLCDKSPPQASNSIAGFAAGASLDRQKSRQFARHLSDADLNQRMGKDAHGMLALSLSCVPPGAAAQTRMVSVAGIRLDPHRSMRSFKGIVYVDTSEFESSQIRSPTGNLRGFQNDQTRAPSKFTGSLPTNFIGDNRPHSIASLPRQHDRRTGAGRNLTFAARRNFGQHAFRDALRALERRAR